MPRCRAGGSVRAGSAFGNGPSGRTNDSMIGKRIHQYEILDKISVGGMGQVYFARDERLGRNVAIKFIGTGLSPYDDAKGRFLREAKAASALDHPNICTIHEIEEAPGGELFIVMAHYKGPSLSHKISTGGRLPAETAVSYARQMASGLVVAHTAGIVHRDIKPANVLLAGDELIKIVDFGIAKITEQEGMTKEGTIVGTLSYMSPEQTSGHGVDHRTDIWSTGTVFYEMLTGRPAFQIGSRTPPEMIWAIHQDHPAMPSSLVSDVPLTLDRVVARCLAKSPNDRFQSCAELIAALDGWREPLASDEAEQTRAAVAITVPPPAVLKTASMRARRSVLVLPFLNHSKGDEDDYISDGITDEVITDLSRLDSLRVISRTSSQQLKGSQETLSAIAERAGVEYIVEGGMQRMGDNLRVTAKLIDVVHDDLIWGDKFKGQFADLFDIQEEIARQVAAALEVNVSPTKRHELAERPIADIEAYDFYLRAKQEILRYSKEAIDRALIHLEKARAITGDNVLLLSAIGKAHWWYINAGHSSDPKHLDKATAVADEILSIDPNSPHGFRLHGMVQIHRGDPEQAIRHLNRALADAPNDAETIGWLVACHGLVGKPEIAETLGQRLLELDPLTPSYQALPALARILAGRFTDALEPLEGGLALDPGNPMVRMVYGQALALADMREAADEVLLKLEQDLPNSLFYGLARFLRKALAGEKELALAAVSDAHCEAARGDAQFSWILAQCYSLIGENAEAVSWLANAVSRGFINYPLFSELDPFLAGLREEPEFVELMVSVERRWQSFDAGLPSTSLIPPTLH